MAQTLESDLEGNNEHPGNICLERPTSSEAEFLIRLKKKFRHTK